MYLLLKLKSFFANDDGAITVDWVVLTAAVIGLTVVGASATLLGVETAGSNIATSLSTKTVD